MNYSKNTKRENQAVSQRVSQKRRELPQGSIYKHHKTNGYYLRIRWPGEEKPCRIPLVPVGKTTATKNKAVALAIAKRIRGRLLFSCY